MKVRECMCNSVEWVNVDTSIRDVSKIMLEKHIGCILICNDEQQIEGIATDRDIVARVIATNRDVDTTTIGEIMTTNIYDIGPDEEVGNASKIMCDCQIKRIPVIENNKPIGIITLGDLANNKKVSLPELGNTVQEICECNGNPKNAE